MILDYDLDFLIVLPRFAIDMIIFIKVLYIYIKTILVNKNSLYFINLFSMNFFRLKTKPPLLKQYKLRANLYKQEEFGTYYLS